LDIPRESVVSKMNFIKMKNEKSKKGLFDVFLCKTKNLEEKRGGPREATELIVKG